MTVNINEWVKNYILDNKKSPKFLIKTYGCQMNERDSESINWILSKNGFIETDDEDDADIVIFNTCAVRQNAENRLIGNLGELKHKTEKSGKKQIVAICGCVMEIDQSRDFILDKFKNVDIIFGTNNISKLEEIIEKYINTKQKVIDIDQIDINEREKIGSKNKFSFKSFVNIMYGCNNFCSFCIVPYTRGREVSREPEKIIFEIKNLISKGVKEITLLGQNVNSYGKNLKEKIDFADLLAMINKIDGLERIRFMTSHPKDISEKLIDCYKNLDKLMPYLHLPVQSGSDRILNIMNRKYDSKSYLNIIDKIRRVRPNIAISTDIIVGFPGESDDDFHKTIKLIRSVQFDSAFTFIYSKRPGTPAAFYTEQVNDEIKNERLQKLMEIQNTISRKKNFEKVGTLATVLVEGISYKNENYLTGRAEDNRLVNFKADKKQIGEIIKVKINEANSFSLKGEVIDEY